MIEIDPLNDAVQKMMVTLVHLGKGMPKADHDAANRIRSAMSVANVIHTTTAAGKRRLAFAALSYAEAVVRDLIGSEAVPVSGDCRERRRGSVHP
jgi:hypothetical protein